MSMKIGPDRSGNAIPVMTSSSKLLAGERRHGVRVRERVRVTESKRVREIKGQ